MQFVTMEGTCKGVIYWERKSINLQRARTHCRDLSIGWKNERRVVIIPTFIFTVIVFSPVC